jgi:hypothetical protein
MGRMIQGLIDVTHHPFRRNAGRLGRRELLVAAGLLLLLIVGTYGRYVGTGTWVADDWQWIRLYHFMDGSRHSPLDLFAASHQIFPDYRPIAHQVLQPLMAFVSGESPGPRVLMGIVLAALEAVLFYVVLRLAGLRWLPAVAGAVLLGLLPSVDATRLWFTAFHQTLAASFYLGGLAAALISLRASDRKRTIGLAIGSAALYAAAISTYESFVFLVPLSVLLYAVIAGVRPALRRWPIDLGVTIVAGYLTSKAAEESRAPDLSASHLLDRANQVGGEALDVIRHSLPADQMLWGPLGLVLTALVLVGLARALRRRDSVARATRGWLLVGGIGLIFAAAGLLGLLPGESELALSSTGNNNRLNLAPSLGYVLLLLAIMWLAATGIAEAVGRPRLLTPLAVGILAASVASFAAEDWRNLDSWTEAKREQNHVLGGIMSVLGPHPPPGTGVITFGYPYERPDGVRIFYSADLAFALRLKYEDDTLDATSFRPDFPPLCGPDSLVTVGVEPEAAEPGTDVAYPYSSLYFVDFGNSSWERISHQRQCRLAMSRALAGHALRERFAGRSRPAV